MNMQDVGITLSDSVVKALTDYGETRGWVLGETIRYIIGEYVGSHLIFNFPSPLQVPTTGVAFPDPASKGLGNVATATQNAEEQTSKMVRQMAWLAASTGAAKCRVCSQSMTADDIMAGKCSKCDTAL